MTFELQKHLLEGVDVNNNPGGAFILEHFLITGALSLQQPK